jgi:hypothetical protein
MRNSIALMLICILLLAAASAAQASASDMTGTIGAERWRMESAVDGNAMVLLAKGAEGSRELTLQCTCLREHKRYNVLIARFSGATPIQAWQSIVDGAYFFYQAPPPGKSAVAGFYAPDGQHFTGEALPSCLAPFLGFFAGDCIGFQEVKQQASRIALERIDVDGVPCQSVSLDSSDYGHYQVCYDPASGLLPRSAQVRKSGHQYAGRRHLEDGPPRTPAGSAGPTPVVELLFTLDHVKVERVQGWWFPISCRVTRVLRYGDGNRETTVMNWRKTALTLDPEISDEAFKPELRQGARLSNLTEPQLAMQWKDGRATPLVDAKILTQMDRTADALRRERQSAGAGQR